MTDLGCDPDLVYNEAVLSIGKGDRASTLSFVFFMQVFFVVVFLFFLVSGGGAVAGSCGEGALGGGVRPKLRGVTGAGEGGAAGAAHACGDIFRTHVRG